MTKEEITALTKLSYTTEPTLSLGLNGVTQVKASTFKSRFTGSKKFIVDRDGKLLEKIKPSRELKPVKDIQHKRTYSINKTRVRNVLLNFINAQKGTKQLYFITITFPCNLNDNLAYSLMNSWLTTLRNSQNLKSYLWIAERQQNSTIHFHIATATKLNIIYANSVMRNLLHYSIRKQKLNWSHTSAAIYNGVDLAKDRRTKRVTNFAAKNSGKNLSGYLSKYISKSTIKFKRQAWQCSRDLSGYFTHVCLTVPEFEKLFLEYIDINECLIECEFFNFFRWANSPPEEVRQLLSDINNTVIKKSIPQRKNMMASSGV